MDITYEELAYTYSRKSTDELLELYASGHLTEMAYTVLEADLAGRGVALPSRPAQPKDLKAEDPILEYWLGKRSLAKTFWIIGVFGGIIVLFFMTIYTMRFGKGLLVQSIVLIPATGYVLFAAGSIWQCANNKGFWGVAARASIVLIPLLPVIIGLAYLGFSYRGGIVAQSSESSTTIYEDRQFRFSIKPPEGWTKQVSPPSEAETVVKFLNESGAITVAARAAQDFHKKIIDLVSEHDLTEKQLAELADEMYGTTSSVIGPTLVITHLGSQKALGSYYVYEHRSLGTVLYMVLFKAETIRGNIFYKVEIAGPAATTPEEASSLFANSSELMLEHMGTFTFLPGKP